MSKRDIKNFLPPIYSTDEIKNFLDSTSNKLFEEKQSERINYYIGKRNGGVYDHISDPYSPERTKLREDYQLDPSLVERDPQTGDVVSILYYEDLLNNLKSAGSLVQDQNRLFSEDVYSYAPPIDYDMFVNYRDYYWMPEGAPSVRVEDSYDDIVGSINYAAKVEGVDEYLTLTTGNHIVLGDNKEYIVDGVGDFIRLQEFNVHENKPLRVPRTFFTENLSTYELFPKEYITMERGALDTNTWSRNNSWYHRNALFPQVTTVPSIKIDRERRALRPIIQFVRDIELFNYPNVGTTTATLYHNGNDLPTDIIDDVNLVNGMTAINNINNNLYQFNGTSWLSLGSVSGKVVILNGRTKKSSELVWNNGWKLLQSKTANTQPILFNLYNNSNEETASFHNSNTIFTYKESETGIYDSELQLTIEYRMSGDSSDFTFVNSLRNDALLSNNTELSYKVMNTTIPISERLLSFTIGENANMEPTIFVNDDELPTIIVNSGFQYEFEYSDSSTTATGWFNEYYPITIVNSDGVQVIKPTHGHSYNTRVTFSYELPDGVDKEEMTYRLETNYEISGKIIILPNVDQLDFNLYNEYRLKGKLYNTLTQSVKVETDGQVVIDLEYQPRNDNFTVMNNGEDVPEYDYSNRKVTIPNAVRGDFVEVSYITRNRISNNSQVVQEIHPSLTNNSNNDDPLEFSFSDMFNHFGSIIRNQRYLTGTPLGTNNYRDTGKDISVGSFILKHSTPMLPLMFINKNDDLNLIDAIEYSNSFYTQYKNNLILKIEEYQRDNVINSINTKDVFDNIITEINSSKQATDSFNSSFMFASYKNYINVRLNESGHIVQNITLGNSDNVIYLYVNDGTLKIKDIDYTISFNETLGLYHIAPISFSYSDVSIIRYYDDVQPTFCPSTPAKFGFVKPVQPTFEIDDTYKESVLMIIGHDNSRTLAYTKIDEFENNIIDGRDLILLEFENRVYNGIDSRFKNEDRDVIDRIKLVPGKFRNTEYSLKEYNSLEYERFFRWSTLNMTDYTTNISYEEGNDFSYNYSYNVDMDGAELPGHWKGIFNYYYDTYMPHTKPWEMLGFGVKPSWFDNEYGTDYSSSNNKLWNDLEEGIIRHGERSNVFALAYLNNNPYRRVGLSGLIPVNENGELRSPIEIGITTEPQPQNAKRPWRYGDNSPVEQAWKTLSEYQFNNVYVLYLLKPAEVATRLWDTTTTIIYHDNMDAVKVSDYRINTDSESVTGITQWMYDLALGDNLNPESELIIPFENISLNLSHKVGGFVNASELKLYSESYNPDSETLSTLVPQEDVNITTYQSKDIYNEVYSGVVIERIEASKAFYAHVNGFPYTQGDIIYVFEDDAYYRKNATSTYSDWKSGTEYVIGDEIIYDNKVFVAIQEHTASNTVRPENESFWELKSFNSSEWAILINPPKTSKTEFRIYGYNVRSPYFPVSIPMQGGKRKTVDITTSKSSPVNANPWVSGQYYKRGHIVTYNNEYYEADVSHRSASNFDTSLWIRWSSAPMVGTVRVSYSTESSGNVDMVEYGQRFKTIDEVVEFLASYGRQLENRGWIFKDTDRELNVTKDWNFIIKEFVRWSVDHRDAGSAITLSPFSNNVSFKPEHGVVSLINQFKASAFNLLDYRSSIIPTDAINVTRVNNVFKLESPEPVYFLRVGIREYEHSITVNNETIFGDVNYQPILGIRKDRLRMSGTKSLNWDGTLHAPGYIITDDNMLPNFNTVSEELLLVNDMDTVATKDIINELKYHNLGYQKRSYLENLEMSEKSQINFYQGFIRQKGTSEAFQRLLRSNVIDANDTLDISEEWAFREGVFGSNYNKLQVEFALSSEQFNFNPQNINLVYNNSSIVTNSSTVNLDFDDPNEWIMKPERIRENGTLWGEIDPIHKFKTAGYVHFNEHNLKSLNLSMLNSIMLDNAIDPTINMTVWVAVNEIQTKSWDVLNLTDTNSFVGEIYNHGNDGENSAVVKAYNVNESDIYVIYTDEQMYNVRFKYIKDGYYIILSHNMDEYVTFDPSIEYMNLNILCWKSLRITDNTTINEFIASNSITVYEGMYVYHDGKDYNWNVYQYLNDEWVSIRKPSKVVDVSLFNDIVAYDENDEFIDYIRAFDPIQGIIPGSMLHEIDIVTDIDPINYTSNEYSHAKYSQMVGTLWLNTNDLVYIDYHQGNTDYRLTHWGSLFPGANASVYEWVKSYVVPSEFDGEVLSTTKYVTQNIFDNNLGIYKTHYYFWVRNNTDISNSNKRTISANEISQSIRYPYNNGIPLIKIVDNYTLSIIDNSQRIIMRDIVLRMNYNYQHTNVATHTQWLLLSESSDNDVVPDFIFDKMIDSILGYTQDLKLIPDPHIPETSRYGVNRGQTWFNDVVGARKIFFNLINEFMKTINIWDIDLFWERIYGGLNTDTDFVSLIEWNHEEYDKNTIITSIVESRIDITLVPLFDGEYVKVLEPNSIKPSMRDGGWTIYRYNKSDDSYTKMAQSGATFKFDLDKIISDGISDTTASVIRVYLNMIFETFTIRPYHEIINNLLFSMVRFVMSTQPNNNWLFPSTYISIRQELLNLIPKFMYRRDREQEIRDYVQEAKPFHTKLRTFNKINKPNDEYIALKVTDFDKPPYVDEYKNQFILQEKFIDKIEPKPELGQTTFELENGHTLDTVRVTNGDRFVSSDQYQIKGRNIIFVDAPEKNKNYVKGIIVESDNKIHRNIINDWNPTYGYSLLDQTRDNELWAELAINKHIEIHYDRNTFENTTSLEEIVSIHNYAFNEVDEPYAYLDSLSSSVNDRPFLRELDRVLIHMYINDVRNIVDQSMYLSVDSPETYIFYMENIIDDELIFLNNEILRTNNYKIIEHDTDIELRFLFELMPNDQIIIRPKNDWLQLMNELSKYSGLNVSSQTPTFIPEMSMHQVVDVDSVQPMMVNDTTGDMDVHVFTHGDDSDPVISGGTFGNENRDYPEERSRLNIYETMVFMSLNHLPPLVKMGYDTLADKIIQPSKAFTIEEGVYDYNLDIVVPSDQVKVIIDNDTLIDNIDYTVLTDRIRLLKDKPLGKTLVVTDLYSNFDPNHHSNVKRIKNINGGFDSYVFDYSRITEAPVTREFIVYTKNGLTHYMKANDKRFINTIDKPDVNSDSITLDNDYGVHRNKLFAIFGYDQFDENSEMENVEFEIVRGSIINNTLTNMTRGLFVGENYSFTHLQNVIIYELSVEDGLENYVIQESIVGETNRNSYPKYGNIFK